MRFSPFSAKAFGCTASAIAMIAGAPGAHAEDAGQYSFNLPAQPLGISLRAVAIITHRNIVVASTLTDGRTAPALSGDLTLDEALTQLLAGTGLAVTRMGNTLVIRAAAAGLSATGENAADVVVTGTRIRGAAVASPVITLDRETIRDAGQASLGDVVRSIPQSFGGGQNPGIGFNVPAINGVDTGGGSSINLRGLGSDATLTLLNGHRVAYSGSRQSVDVSTIPLGALDRIEIVPDGASALYGSDAVGGVANIILRRDMAGVETAARIGRATEGGDFQQQYNATGGARWASGGFIAAYEFNRATAIDARDRGYAATRSPGLRLLPSARNNNALISAHQTIAPGLDFTIDGLFNKRGTFFLYPQNPAGDLAVSRSEQATTDTAFAVAPALSLALGEGARLALSGSYAEDRVDYRNDLVTPAARTLLAAGCYCNRTESVELSGDGRLFRLPGGWAKAAIGIGYRNSALLNDRGAGNALNFNRSQANHYAYGELSLPLVSPDNGVAGVTRLTLSAAARYEHYDGIGSVANPKLGLVYAPIPALDLKASWGRSFRAPTLLQRYQPPALTLLRAATLGASGVPAAASVLYLQGGNPALKPERAASWSLSAAFHPPALPGFNAEVSYFSTNYTDRIVTPIGFITQSLSNPIYAAQVTRSPSAALLAATLASSGLFTNSTGAPYDPGAVVALVDNSNVNAGRQPIHGIDALVSYRTDLGPRDSMTLTGNASYLVSHRQISADQPVLPLAGILFNPPHWRARASAGWRHDGMSLTAVTNYLGPLSDTRATRPLRIPGQATIDLTLRYRTPDRAPGILRGLDVSLSVQNLFDAAPPLIATGPVTDTPYDSTNYSAVGRFVAVTIARKW
ncbi:TonB-dependent receptor [uncultured Sphingomonas sp.]|uniref:TonB-dependent receptor n=1 Tax=uncultured Sphingomonas sp. TaxID=158754 RepID=UPI00261D5961|nr:TonB-dependent receptor [uncultured Sphingomonas sp.]